MTLFRLRIVAVTTVIGVLTIGSAYMAVKALELPAGWGPGALGPRSIPLYTFIGMTACSIAVGIGEWRALRQARLQQAGSGSHRPRGAEADFRGTGSEEGGPGVSGDAGAESGGISPGRILMVLGSVILFAAVWQVAGFILSAIGLTAGLSYFLAPASVRSLTTSLLLAIGFTGAVWILFRLVLGVPLPAGPF